MVTQTELQNKKLSDQAIATLMVTLQKCILEQTDITKMLKGYDFGLQDDQLVVLNPPSKLGFGTNMTGDIE